MAGLASILQKAPTPGEILDKLRGSYAPRPREVIDQLSIFFDQIPNLGKGFSNSEKKQWWEKKKKFKIGLIRSHDLETRITVINEHFDFSKRVSHGVKGTDKLNSKKVKNIGFNLTGNVEEEEVNSKPEKLYTAKEFDEMYLGWLEEDKEKTRPDEEKTLIKSVMKQLFRYMFGTKKIKDINDFHTRLIISYTKLNPVEKIPCTENDLLRKHLLQSLYYRLQSVRKEIVASTTVLGEQAIYVDDKKDLLMGLRDLINALEDKESYCIIYGNDESMVPDAPIKRTLYSDADYDRLLKIFKYLLLDREKDKPLYDTYEKFRDGLIKGDLTNSKKGTELYRELLGLLDMTTQKKNRELEELLTQLSMLLDIVLRRHQLHIELMRVKCDNCEESEQMKQLKAKAGTINPIDNPDPKNPLIDLFNRLLALLQGKDPLQPGDTIDGLLGQLGTLMGTAAVPQVDQAAQIAALQAQIQGLTGEVGNLQEQLRNIIAERDAAIQGFQALLAQNQTIAAQLADVIAQLQQANARYNALYDEAIARLQAAAEDLQRERERAERAEAELATLIDAQQATEEQLTAARAEAAEARAEAAAAAAALQAAQAALAELQARYDALEAARAAAAAAAAVEIQARQDRIDEFERNGAASAAELEGVRGELEAAQQRNAELERDLAAAQARIAVLEAANQALNQAEAQRAEAQANLEAAQAALAAAAAGQGGQQAALEALQAQLEATQEQLRACEAAAAEARAAHAQAIADLQAQLDAQLEAAQAAVRRAEAARAAVAEDAATARGQAADSEAARIAAVAALAAANAQLAAVREQIAALQAASQGAAARIERLEGELETSQDAAGELQRQLTTARAEKAACDEALAAAREQLQALEAAEARATVAEGRATAAEAALREAEARIRTLTEQITAKDREIEQLRTRLAEGDSAELRRQLEECEAEKARLKEEIDDLKSKYILSLSKRPVEWFAANPYFQALIREDPEEIESLILLLERFLQRAGADLRNIPVLYNKKLELLLLLISLFNLLLGSQIDKGIKEEIKANMPVNIYYLYYNYHDQQPPGPGQAPKPKAPTKQQMQNYIQRTLPPGSSMGSAGRYKGNVTPHIPRNTWAMAGVHGGGISEPPKIPKSSFCETMLTLLLLQAQQVQGDSFDYQAFLDKAGATLDDLGQCPIVLHTLNKLIDMAVENNVKGDSFKFKQLKEAPQQELSAIEEAFNNRFNEDEQDALGALSPRVIFSKPPEEYEQILGRTPYMLNMTSNNEPLEGDEFDEPIYVDEKERDEITTGGVPLGALVFLYLNCLRQIEAMGNTPSLNSKCLLPTRSKEMAKTPKAKSPRKRQKKTKAKD